ncbi:MAG: hypothetical protein GX357_03430 [Firmicutes bacterium]|nr:hypothetical protein [Bacillota bacterium]
MLKLCLAVHHELLAAALAVKKVERPLSTQETLQACAQRYQAKDTPYPAWYLFGCREKEVTGLVTLYTRQGINVFLCPDHKLGSKLKADIIDVQFCTLSSSLYTKFTSQGKKIIGYLPPSFASKAYLATKVQAENGGKFLPVQKVYTKDSEPLLPAENIKVWILKWPYGSAGKSCTGAPYTVWQAEHLQNNLPKLLAGLEAEESFICSEFILTRDPYAGYADHVVHKMPFLASPGSGVKAYGSYCQKFISHCNWAALEKKHVLPLGDFIQTTTITTGKVDTIKLFPEFIQSLSFHQGCVMFSVDFMVPPDGIPRFLESNKLAATFAEKFDPHLPPLVDYYGSKSL